MVSTTPSHPPSPQPTPRGFKHLARRLLSALTRAILRSRSQSYPISNDAVTVIIAPHQDDEALGCGGLLALRSRRGHRLHIAYVTDGAQSHAGHPTLSPAALASLRREEARQAMALLGLDPSSLTFLGARDGSLAHLEPTSAQRLVDVIASYLKSISPTEIFLPSRRDGSSEHDAAFLLVDRALAQAGLKPRILEFPIWSWWNPSLILPEILRIRRVWRVEFRGEAGRKRAALAAYRSQMEPTAPWQHPLISAEFVSFFAEPEEFFFER